MTPFALRIQNATYKIGGRVILDNINWDVRSGERRFILGANGAGKTSLVKLILGYAWPLFGAKIETLGQVYGSVNLPEHRKQIAWVSPIMHDWMTDFSRTGLEMVVSGIDATIGVYRDITEDEKARATELLCQLRGEQLLNQRLCTMSSGEQVKILIARALITKPQLMILDEPTVYMDITGREFLLKTIDNLAQTRPELTILFITQGIEDILPTFNQGIILKQGRIVANGTRDEILTEDKLKEAFDFDIRLIHTSSGRLWTVIE